MKFSVFIKKLKNPRVKRRLKIALSVYGVAILLGVLCKVVYDIGFFNAQALVNQKTANLPTATRQVLTVETAQRIVSGALKENPANPKTIVTEIIDHNNKISAILIENNQQKKLLGLSICVCFSLAIYSMRKVII